MNDSEVQPLLRLARAVENLRPADMETAVRDQIEAANADVRSIAFAAPVFALLGRADLTFGSLERYFLNRGTFGTPAPIGPYTRRYSDNLYAPSMKSLRSDPRLARGRHEAAAWAGLKGANRHFAGESSGARPFGNRPDPRKLPASEFDWRT